MGESTATPDFDGGTGKWSALGDGCKCGHVGSNNCGIRSDFSIRF